jgi:hypothetical protein
MKVKIWIDDLRAAPEGWIWVHTYDEAVGAIGFYKGNISNIAFDHDLGACDICAIDDDLVCGNNCECSCHKTGYDVICWMEAFDAWPEYPPTVHSANPVGRRRIFQVINRKYGLP